MGWKRRIFFKLVPPTSADVTVRTISISGLNASGEPLNIDPVAVTDVTAVESPGVVFNDGDKFSATMVDTSKFGVMSEPSTPCSGEVNIPKPAPPTPSALEIGRFEDFEE